MERSSHAITYHTLPKPVQKNSPYKGAETTSHEVLGTTTFVASFRDLWQYAEHSGNALYERRWRVLWGDERKNQPRCFQKDSTFGPNAVALASMLLLFAAGTTSTAFPLLPKQKSIPFVSGPIYLVSGR